MNRYIDADLLMKELGITDPDCEKCGWGQKGLSYCTRDGDFVDACVAICDAPTADVRENVHAHWKPVHLTAFGVCSVCGAKWQFTELMSFCPNCGAEMEGE